MILSIVLDDPTETEHLAAVAAANNLTEEQYATNIVRGWLQSQVKDIYIGAVRRMPVDDIVKSLGTLANVKSKGAI